MNAITKGPEIARTPQGPKTHACLIQAGHYPHGGGAPGEALWNYQLAQMIAARLQAARVACTVVGDFLGQAAPSACAGDYDLFLALHYDAAIYAARGERNSGCFADRATDETRPDAADRFIRIWEAIYPARTGIALANRRRNPNTNQYYAFRALTVATPGVILEHGCGAPVASGPYPPGDDATLLHDRIDLVADADAAAILQFLGVSTPAPPVVALPDVGEGLVPSRSRVFPSSQPAEDPDIAGADLKTYFEQLGQPVNLATAVMQRAALAYRRGETRGAAVSGEYAATAPDGRAVVRQDFSAGICEYDPATGNTGWVEVILHPEALRGYLAPSPSGRGPG